jgi:Fe-S-cluster containining protein
MSEPVADPCAECGGKCCSFREINIGYRELDDDEKEEGGIVAIGYHDDQLFFEDNNGELVFGEGIPDMDWYIKNNQRIVFECNHLTEDGKCGVYNKRPDMCRSFECPALTGEETLEEFLNRVQYREGQLEDSDLEEITEEFQQGLRKLLADLEDSEE